MLRRDARTPWSLSAPALLLAVTLVLVPRAEAQEAANGVFLVARPELKDPTFAESVVLVTRHQGGGTVGVILNRPTTTRLSEVFPGQKHLDKRPDVVFSGGPVAPGTLVLVFRSTAQPASALHVLDDVYMTLDPEVMEHVLARPDATDFRVYSGYAGWAPAQLEVEIHRGGWHVLDADEQTLFHMSPDAMWRTLLGRASPRTRADRPGAEVTSGSHVTRARRNADRASETITTPRTTTRIRPTRLHSSPRIASFSTKPMPPAPTIPSTVDSRTLMSQR
jgi:putative transcriptional regulator